MRVIRHYVENELRNFNYVIGCDEIGEAIAVDPLDAEAVLDIAEQNNWTIKLIINTHEHRDHIDGNPHITAASGAVVCAHHLLIGRIPAIDRCLRENEIIELGSIRLRVLSTPGHTACHICLLSLPARTGERAAFFSGDTLFNASAGNCQNGGNVEDLYSTFSTVISALGDSTLLYPGHDYLSNNLRFALNCDSSNQEALRLLDQVQELDGHSVPIMTLGDERTYNPFLRLSEPAVMQRVAQIFPAEVTGPREIFIGLRRLRDKW